MLARRRLLALLAMATSIAPRADAAPLPMRTEEPLVYATSIADTFILEFKRYDDKTGCWLHLRKDTWDQVRANTGQLPAAWDLGRLHCERR